MLLERELPPTEKKGEYWNYSFFREYLLAIGTSSRFLYPKAELPQQIQLSGDWHKTIQELRIATGKDKRERLSMIGINANTRQLYLQSDYLVGGKKHVGSQRDIYDRATKSGLITTAAGGIHTHPPHAIMVLARAFAGFPAPSFSAGDLHNIVTNRPGVHGVVDNQTNIFALCSRETAMLDETTEPLQDVRAFKKYWHRKYPFENEWTMSKAIAKEYHLGLYKGTANQDLIRVV